LPSFSGLSGPSASFIQTRTSSREPTGGHDHCKRPPQISHEAPTSRITVDDFISESPKIDVRRHIDPASANSYGETMHTNLLLHDDCFAIRQAARQISQLYDRYLADAGLTPSQFSLLTAIQMKQGQTTQQLARTMVMERTTVLRALRPLLTCGYIIDERGENTGRRLTLGITTAGIAKCAEAAICWQAAQIEFERTFGSVEASQLRTELFRITNERPNDEQKNLHNL
jgi:DNA-binding MarR family transcriptional regulator